MGKTRNGKITERQLRMIEMRAEGHTLAEVGAFFGITGSGARDNINVAERMIRKHGLSAVLPDGVRAHHTQEELLSGLPEKKHHGPRIRLSTGSKETDLPSAKQELLTNRSGNTMKYTVEVTQIRKGYVEIDADSRGAALRIADDLYNKQGRELPDMEDSEPLQFSHAGEPAVSPLFAFIDEEVPFRFENIFQLDVPKEVLVQIAEALKEENDVMFDYDRLDEFLLDQYEELTQGREDPEHSLTEDMIMAKKVEYHRNNVVEQIHILTDVGVLDSDQEIYCLTHIDAITAQYVKQADAWEAKHGQRLSLSFDLEIIENAIGSMAQKAPSQASTNAHLHETDLYQKALAHFNGKACHNIENEFVRNHAAELIACYENDKDLLDFDFWTRYEALMGEKLTLDEYQTIDSLFSGDPLEIAPSDTTVIAGWKADLEDYRNKPQSFTERLTSAIERAAVNAQQHTPEKEPSI